MCIRDRNTKSRCTPIRGWYLPSSFLSATNKTLLINEMCIRDRNSPVDYFNKYPGRFKIFHVKDHREIGQSGMVGFDAIFKNAKTADVYKRQV